MNSPGDLYSMANDRLRSHIDAEAAFRANGLSPAGPGNPASERTFTARDVVNRVASGGGDPYHPASYRAYRIGNAGPYETGEEFEEAVEYRKFQIKAPDNQPRIAHPKVSAEAAGDHYLVTVRMDEDELFDFLRKADEFHSKQVLRQVIDND